MFCSDCGSQMPDDSKFCSKCGKPTASSQAPKPSSSTEISDSVIQRSQIATVQGDGVGNISGSDVNVTIDKRTTLVENKMNTTVLQNNAISVTMEEDRDFQALIKQGLEIALRGVQAIYLYKKKPRDKFLVDAQSSYDAAFRVIKQLEEHQKLKGKSPEERMKVLDKEPELQRLYAGVYQGLGALEYFHKNFIKAAETHQEVITKILPANSVFVVECIKVRDSYINNIRSDDFDAWVKIKKDVLKEPIDVNSLSFFEKRKYNP